MAWTLELDTWLIGILFLFLQYVWCLQYFPKQFSLNYSEIGAHSNVVCAG